MLARSQNKYLETCYKHLSQSFQTISFIRKEYEKYTDATKECSNDPPPVPEAPQNQKSHASPKSEQVFGNII